MHGSNGYKVTVKLHHTCDMEKEKALALRSHFNESDIRLFEEEHIGPDEIIIQFEGASLQAQLALVDSERCNEYYALFQVPMAGAYRLKVARLRSEWNAVKMDAQETNLKYEILIDSVVDDQLAFYSPAPCKQSGQGYWVSNVMQQISPADISLSQECEQEGQQRGVPGLTTRIPLNARHEKDGCAVDIENFSWNRKICRESYVHSRDGIGEVIFVNDRNVTDTRPSHEKNANWFMNKKIAFIGDSHMRGLFDVFFTQVCLFV